MSHTLFEFNLHVHVLSSTSCPTFKVWSFYVHETALDRQKSYHKNTIKTSVFRMAACTVIIIVTISMMLLNCLSFSFLVIVRNGFIILPPTSALTNSTKREANESSGESLNLSMLNESLPTLPELTCFLNRSLTGLSWPLDDLPGSALRGRSLGDLRGVTEHWEQLDKHAAILTSR